MRDNLYLAALVEISEHGKKVTYGFPKVIPPALPLDYVPAR